jgi:peptidyl-prolyl cis-trans isomerase C
MKSTLFYTKGLFSLAVFVFLITACRPAAVQPTLASPGVAASTPTPVLTATASPASPTATEAPLVARVNGEGITLAEFETELSLYHQATGLEPSQEDQQRVLDSLIDQSLLAQAASEKGFTVDETKLQTRLDALASNLGGEAALAQWIDDHGYSSQTFQQSLVTAVAAAWMRDQVTGAVPPTAEQVHARQILVYDAKTADEIFTQLQAGNDFANLANQYDPVTGGDLGWFPRGYLPDANLETAAFALQPGQYSPVVQTVAGFHILQVTERDAQHPLTPEALLVLQGQALQSWLVDQRQQSDIQILASQPG